MNVGKALVELLAERSDEIESRYDLRLILTAAVDIARLEDPGTRQRRDQLLSLKLTAFFLFLPGFRLR